MLSKNLITLSFLGFFLFLAFYSFVLLPGIPLVWHTHLGLKGLAVIKEAVGRGQIEVAAKEAEEMQGRISKIKHAYRQFSYLRFFPLFNLYYQDGSHLIEAVDRALGIGGEVLALLLPFQNVLGTESGFGELLTAKDYIDRFVKILPTLSSQADEIAGYLFLLEREILAINPHRYPGEVGEELAQIQHLLSNFKPLFAQTKPLLEVLPHLLGVPPRTYLVLFQNDAELRATGGFITASSLVEVRDGQTGKIESHNIGFVENRTPDDPAPMPYRRYLNVAYWGFRDANLSPDFRVSAAKALSMWQRSSSLPQDVNFIIAVTPEAGQKLLEFTGPIALPGYAADLASFKNLPPSCRTGGATFTSNNLTCKLEFYVEAFYAADPERKGVIGELSEVILEKLQAAPKERWPQLLSVILETLTERTVLLYSADSREQNLIEQLDFGGRIKEFYGDYLHISDSNFGGLKTDLVMTQEVEQELTRLEDGRWRKTVKIHYYNPQPYDRWMSANYKDWVRIYVPKGSRLVSVEGARDIWTTPETWSRTVVNPEGWEELGKTVFGAYFTLWPQKKHTLTFVYDLPPEASAKDGHYRLLIQKQPGTNITLVKIKIDGKIKSFDLKADREITIPFNENN